MDKVPQIQTAYCSTLGALRRGSTHSAEASNAKKPPHHTVFSRCSGFLGNGVFYCFYCNYPFTAPAVIPSIKYFWKQRNTTNTGMMPNMEPAISTS